QWTVVHGRRRRGHPRRGARAGSGYDDPFTAAGLAAGLGTTLIDLSGDDLRALVPGPAVDGTDPAQPDPAGRVEAQPGWTLGAGAPVPADELARGDAEAARALRRALAERRGLVRQRTDEVAGVASLVAPREGRALARTRLGPLEEHPALVETLRMWLSLHGSWDRTAVALEIHRNTVRQRIARIGELLGQDLAEQDVRMELWFALKWC
ncbi:MAG: PucR family transcriptional regulator, partial [Streptomyces sp.]|uniref:PucR family transcriptional regulator n=1 Tax=Streptomyces sp. TaxID=1931 RepID=UPI003D6AE4D4